MGYISPELLRRMFTAAGIGVAVAVITPPVAPATAQQTATARAKYGSYLDWRNAYNELLYTLNEPRVEVFDANNPDFRQEVMRNVAAFSRKIDAFHPIEITQSLDRLFLIAEGLDLSVEELCQKSGMNAASINKLHQKSI